MPMVAAAVAVFEVGLGMLAAELAGSGDGPGVGIELGSESPGVAEVEPRCVSGAGSRVAAEAGFEILVGAGSRFEVPVEALADVALGAQVEAES